MLPFPDFRHVISLSVFVSFFVDLYLMNTTNWLWLKKKKKCFKLSGERIKDQTVECETGSFWVEVKETLRDVESSGRHYEVKRKNRLETFFC